MTGAPQTTFTEQHPFPGLRPFEREDSAFFFGRRDQILGLYRLVDRSRFVAVVGGSGSGKSSLARAGLLPLIEPETKPDGDKRWRILAMRPGSSPLRHLSEGLANLATDSSGTANAILRERVGFYLADSSYGIEDTLREIKEVQNTSVLLLIDQFEELFRYASPDPRRSKSEEAASRNEADRFVQLLLQASRSTTQTVHVMLTMRSDFIGDCARFPGLPEVVSASQFLVPSLARDQIEQVILGPIEKAQGHIEPSLVNALLNDADGERDQLPILQHCLFRLWERTKPTERNLTMADYRRIGGVTNALSHHAEEVLTRDLKGHEVTVEQVFRSLGEFDKEGRAIRRPRKFSELENETGIDRQELESVVNRLRQSDCSFLVPALSVTLAPDTDVDIGHEALLRRWTRVSGEPGVLLDENKGWLAAEQRDGKQYRDLVGLVDEETLPLKNFDRRLRWWESRTRTSAWANRYGGNFEGVKGLFAQTADKKRRVRRYQVAGASLAIVLLAIGGGAGWQWYDAWQKAELYRTQAAHHAHQEQEIYKRAVRSTIAVLNAVHGSLVDGAMQARAAKSLLATLEKNVEDVKVTPNEPSVQLLEVRMWLVMSDIAIATGENEKAAERARAIKIRALGQAVVDEKDADKRLRWKHFVYASSFRIGDAIILKNKEEGFKEYREAEAIARELVAERPDNKTYQQDVLVITNKMGEGWSRLGNFAEALGQFRKTQEDAEKLIIRQPQEKEWKRKAAEARTKASAVLIALKDFDRAVMDADDAVTILKPFLAVAGNDKVFPSNLALAWRAHGNALLARSQNDKATPGDANAAIESYKAAIAIWEPFIDSDRDDLRFRDYILPAYENSGELLRQAGKITEARQSVQKEIEIRQALAKRRPSASATRELEAARKKLEDLEAITSSIQAPASPQATPAAAPAAALPANVGGPLIPVPQPAAPQPATPTPQ